jgi:multicomponent Na+:H+ antiporter subunit C
LFCCGLTLLLTRRHLVKIVLGLSLMEDATYLFIVSLAYRPKSTAPVLTGLPANTSAAQVAHGNVADPILQNFCITAIVIGVAITGVFLTIVVRIAQHFGTVDADRVRMLRG